MYLSWIIPVYNEERRIEKTVREVDEYLRSKNFPGGYEIIVVNSSSRDKTSDIVKRLSSEIPAVSVKTVENKGKGWAVAQGMLNSKGGIRLFSDADNSTSPEHFEKMIPLFERGYDVVISSRNSKDAPGASIDVSESVIRSLAGKIGNIIIQLFAVPGIWDTQNGFKAFRKESAENIFSRLTILGFAFDIEALVLARRLRYRIGIIPVKWKHDPDSKVTFGSYLQVFLDVFRIRWNFITRRYKI